MGCIFSTESFEKRTQMNEPMFRCDYCRKQKSDRLYGIDCQECKGPMYLHLSCYLKTSICYRCYLANRSHN